MSGRMSNIYTDKELLAVLNKDITNLTDEQKEIANYVFSDEGMARVINLRLNGNDEKLNALADILTKISCLGKEAYDENGVFKQEYLEDVSKLFYEMMCIVEPIKEKYNDFYNVPSTPIMFFIKQIFATNLFQNNNFKSLDRHTKYEVAELKNGRAMKFSKTNRTSELIVSLEDIQPFTGKNNKGLIKLFAFIMIKCNEQNYNKVIGFSLQELVDNGMYKNTDTARRSVKENLEKIRKLSISGYSKKGINGRKIESEIHSSIITEWRIDNGYVKIVTGEFINIEFIAHYFTILPPYAFKLNRNAFLLLDYIFFTARQNTRSIRENGTFKISLRAVKNYLSLPDETKTQKHTQYIKTPIESAIEEIENENQDINFTITPMFKSEFEPQNINEWLDGYLEIGLKGDFAQCFTSIAQKQENEVKAFKKRKEQALLKAQTKVFQESIKQNN